MKAYKLFSVFFLSLIITVGINGCKKIKTCKDDCEEGLLYNFVGCPSLLRLDKDTGKLYLIDNAEKIKNAFQKNDTVAVCVKFSSVKEKLRNNYCLDGDFIEIKCIVYN